jgi:Na+/proline symporter
VLALLVTGVAFVIADLQETHKLTIVDMMSKFFNMFVGPLAAMFFVGMFLPRCTTRSVLPAALVGLVIAVLWSWSDVIFGIKMLTILLSVAVPCVTTFVLAALLSLFVETGGDHRGRSLTWRAILRRVQVE